MMKDKKEPPKDLLTDVFKKDEPEEFIDVEWEEVPEPPKDLLTDVFKKKD